MHTHHQLTLEQRFTTNSPILKPTHHRLPSNFHTSPPQHTCEQPHTWLFTQHTQTSKHRIRVHTHTYPPTYSQWHTSTHLTTDAWAHSASGEIPDRIQGAGRRTPRIPSHGCTGRETLFFVLLDALSPGLAYLLSVVWSDALSKIINHSFAILPLSDAERAVQVRGGGSEGCYEDGAFGEKLHHQVSSLPWFLFICSRSCKLVTVYKAHTLCLHSCNKYFQVPPVSRCCSKHWRFHSEQKTVPALKTLIVKREIQTIKY